MPLLKVADPELIKTILVKDFQLFPDRMTTYGQVDNIMSKNLALLTGEDWKRIRAIISPTFTSGKMKRMYPMMKICVKS